MKTGNVHPFLAGLLTFLLVLPARLLAQEFTGPVDFGQVQPDFLREISGVAASRKNPGVLWVHNDSGGENAIYALDLHGRLLGVYRLAGAQNRDWEDIAVGPSPEGWAVYVGDIGDNSRRRKTKVIYRVVEPKVDTLQAPVDTVLYDVERVVFAYPDGIYNAETLMVDPQDTSVYVVNKNSLTTVYRLPDSARFSPVPTTHVDTLQVVARLLMKTVVGGDIDPSGREVLIKTYTRIYHWSREKGQTWAEAFARSYGFVPYKQEPQGEGVGWLADGQGYVTISEGLHPHVYVYRRVQTGVRDEERLAPREPELYAKVYPRKERLEVTFHAPAQTLVLRVFDVLGREVASRRVNGFGAGLHRERFDTSGWPSGVYVVQLRAAGATAAATRVAVVR